MTNPGFGKIYGCSETPSFISPEGPVWMWRKRQAVRFYTFDGKQVGPEQSNVAPAVCAALCAGWIDPHMSRLQAANLFLSVRQECAGLKLAA